MLLRLVIGASIGTGIGFLLGLATASQTGDVGLAFVAGGFIGLMIGILVPLFWTGD